MWAILLPLIGAVLLRLLLAEFGDWCPWLATRLVRCAARLTGDYERYKEEWTAVLNEVPGKLSKLMVAIGLLAYAPRVRFALRRASSPSESRASALSDMFNQAHEIEHLVHERNWQGWMEAWARLRNMSGVNQVENLAMATASKFRLYDLVTDRPQQRLYMHAEYLLTTKCGIQNEHIFG